MTTASTIVRNLHEHIQSKLGLNVHFGTLNKVATTPGTAELACPEFTIPDQFATGGLKARLVLQGYVAVHLPLSAELDEVVGMALRLHHALATWSKTPYPDGLGDTLLGFTHSDGASFPNPLVPGEKITTISFNWSMDLLLEVT